MTNNPENMLELKPCPFCGSDGKEKTVWKSRGGGYEYPVYVVECSRCQTVKTFNGYEKACEHPYPWNNGDYKNDFGMMQKARDIWNTRANDTLAEENKRLREALGNVCKNAQRVMSLLEKHGADIVPHLLDTDENAGQLLREALNQTKGGCDDQQ